MSIPRVAAALVAACACATASAQQPVAVLLPSELTTPVVTSQPYYVGFYCWGLPCTQWTFTWEADPNSGGHTHQNTPRTPGVVSVIYPTEGVVAISPGCAKGSCASGRITAATNYPADLDGRVYIQFLAPETAGRIKLCAVADAFPASPLCGTIEVKRQGLARTQFASGTFWATTKVEETGGPPHLPWEGYGTNSTNMRLQRLEAQYNRLLAAAGRLPAHTIKISAISMREGGLADIRTEWLPPHINHRDGRQVDVSMKDPLGRGLTNWEKVLLRRAILSRGVGFRFTVRAESPGNPGATHWHIQ